MRPPARELPRNHPDLCPGSDQPGFHCYPIPPMNRCPICGQQVLPYPVPSIPGGGRLSQHYKPSLLDEVG